MKFIVAFLLLVSLQVASAGEFDWLPDHPGSVRVDVARGNTSLFSLSSADAAVFNSNLARLRDLLSAQPGFNPPKGVAIAGYLRADDEKAEVKGTPVPALGLLKSEPCLRDKETGKPAWLPFTTDEIVVRVNNPLGNLDGFDFKGAEVKLCYEPKRTGEFNGFPLFQTESGDEIIVLTLDGKLPWEPYTREELTNLMIRFWQAAADKTALDKLSPEIVKGHKEFLARMSAEERKMPARYLPSSEGLYGPPLAPIGSTLGLPLVKANLHWFDPSLPRSAFQLITLRFHYSSNLDPAKPAADEFGLVSALRLWQYLRSADLKAIAGALTKK